MLGRSDTVMQRHLRHGALAGNQSLVAASLLATFDLQPPNFTFFDVGANIGLYSWLCKAAAPSSPVVAFEPSPSIADLTRRIAAKNGLDIAIEEIALSDRSGRSELHLSARSDSSSSLVPGFRRARGVVTVALETLDGYVARTGLAPNVVKLDVELHEGAVVRGARETLRGSRPVLVAELLRPRRGVDPASEMWDVLGPLGDDAEGDFTESLFGVGDRGEEDVRGGAPGAHREKCNRAHETEDADAAGLQRDELAVGPAAHLSFRPLGDGSYTHSSVVAFGGPAFVVGSLVGSALGNASRRRQAAAAARPRVPVRYVLIGVTFSLSMLLYIDRIAISTARDPIRISLWDTM